MERTVIAAGISFDRSQLSAAELFTRDLDPLFLERYIRRGNPRATRDLPEGGAELYDRLISEGCAYVIEIADKLPRFQTNAFAELLHRGSQTIDLLNEVLDRIPSKAEGRSEEARFVTACRRRIIAELDRLDLLGLDFDAPWHPLTVAVLWALVAAEPSGGPFRDFRQRLPAAGCHYLGTSPAGRVRRSTPARKDTSASCSGRLAI